MEALAVSFWACLIEIRRTQSIILNIAFNVGQVQEHVTINVILALCPLPFQSNHCLTLLILILQRRLH